jgi:hypothetical protein
MRDQDNNIYGYWQYDDTIGLSCNIEKYDLVYVFKAVDNKAHAVNERGRIISFHKTNITKGFFARPSYKHHKECELGKNSSEFYKTLAQHEHHKNDCHKCQMYEFKQTVNRFKIRQEK